MANYGVPYMGSKSSILKKLCPLFPKADNFYDLFGGGFSVTHFMLQHRSKDYKKFHFNEIRSGLCDLVKDALNGKYSYDVFKPEWISRERFFAEKETNIYIKLIWSFGNGGTSYLYGEDIESNKRSLHNAVVFNEFDSYAKSFFKTDKFKEGYSIKEKRLFIGGSLHALQHLQRIERLQHLQRIERLQQLNFYSGSYDQVKILPNSIIYCDIPYGGTAEYDKNNSFNRKKFFDWADSQDEPVFISEYHVEDSRFKKVSVVLKRSLLSANKDNKLVKDECLYVNKAGLKRLLTKS